MILPHRAITVATQSGFYAQSKKQEDLRRELIRARMAEEISDINRMRSAEALDQGTLPTRGYEIETHVGTDFFGVIIPRAILDPELGRRMPGPCRAETQAIAEFVGRIAFMCGFLRPAVLHEIPGSSRDVALTLTKLLVRP